MSNHLATLCIVLLGGVSSIVIAARQDYIADFERTESIEGAHETIVDFSKLKVIRNKKRERCLNGSFTFAEDLDENYTGEVVFSYSPTGNSGYMKLPYAIPRMKACEFYKKSFEKYARPTFDGHTDFPVAPQDSRCHVGKGTWYVSCATAKTDPFPDHMPRGMIKIELFGFKEDQLIGGLRFFVKVSDKLSF